MWISGAGQQAGTAADANEAGSSRSPGAAPGAQAQGAKGHAAAAPSAAGGPGLQELMADAGPKAAQIRARYARAMAGAATHAEAMELSARQAEEIWELYGAAADTFVGPARPADAVEMLGLQTTALLMRLAVLKAAAPVHAPAAPAPSTFAPAPSTFAPAPAAAPTAAADAPTRSIAVTSQEPECPRVVHLVRRGDALVDPEVEKRPMGEVGGIQPTPGTKTHDANTEPDDGHGIHCHPERDVDVPVPATEAEQDVKSMSMGLVIEGELRLRQAQHNSGTSLALDALSEVEGEEEKELEAEHDSSSRSRPLCCLVRRGGALVDPEVEKRLFDEVSDIVPMSGALPVDPTSDAASDESSDCADTDFDSFSDSLSDSDCEDEAEQDVKSMSAGLVVVGELKLRQAQHISGTSLALDELSECEEQKGPEAKLELPVPDRKEQEQEPESCSRSRPLGCLVRRGDALVDPEVEKRPMVEVSDIQPTPGTKAHDANTEPDDGEAEQDVMSMSMGLVVEGELQLRQAQHNSGTSLALDALSEVEGEEEKELEARPELQVPERQGHDSSSRRPLGYLVRRGDALVDPEVEKRLFDEVSDIMPMPGALPVDPTSDAASDESSDCADTDFDSFSDSLSDSDCEDEAEQDVKSMSAGLVVVGELKLRQAQHISGTSLALDELSECEGQKGLEAKLELPVPDRKEQEQEPESSSSLRPLGCLVRRGDALVDPEVEKRLFDEVSDIEPVSGAEPIDLTSDESSGCDDISPDHQFDADAPAPAEVEQDAERMSVGLVVEGELQLRQAQNNSGTSLVLGGLSESEEKGPEAKLELQAPCGREQEQDRESNPFEMTAEEVKAVYVARPLAETGLALCEQLLGGAECATQPGEYLLNLRDDGAITDAETAAQLARDVLGDGGCGKHQRELVRVLSMLAHTVRRTRPRLCPFARGIGAVARALLEVLPERHALDVLLAILDRVPEFFSRDPQAVDRTTLAAEWLIGRGNPGLLAHMTSMGFQHQMLARYVVSLESADSPKSALKLWGAGAYGERLHLMPRVVAEHVMAHADAIKQSGNNFQRLVESLPMSEELMARMAEAMRIKPAPEWLDEMLTRLAEQ
eukprot:m51a1_g6383 hypothetical protein (1102) ;mRNA; r:181729-186055